MATRMLQRRGTAAEWSAANPVLSDGELGFARDAKILKIGDGVTAWNSLPVVLDTTYVALAGFVEAVQDAAASLLTAGTHSGATVTYDDVNNKLNIAVTGGSGATQYVGYVKQAVDGSWAVRPNFPMVIWERTGASTVDPPTTNVTAADIVIDTRT